MSNDNSAKKDLVLFALDPQTLVFPSAPDTVSKTVEKRTQTAVASHAVRTSEGKTAINSKGLKQILHTDAAGVKHFYSDLDDEDKFKMGNQHYVRTPALRKELDERIEKPYNAKKHAQLRYSSDCLGKVRDDQQAERSRAVGEINIRQGLKTGKAQKIKQDNLTHCALSGQPLQPDAHLHHHIRQADDPDQALNPNNVQVVNADAHATHHTQQNTAAAED